MNDTDGKIVIGTDVDLTGFEKKIENLERRARKKKVDIQVRSANVEATKRELEIVQNKIEDIETEWEKNAEALEKYNELKWKLENDDSSLNSMDYIDLVAYQDMHLDKLQKRIDEDLLKLQGDQDKLNAKLAKQKQLLSDSKYAYEDIIEKVNIEKQNLEDIKAKQIIKNEEVKKAGEIRQEIAEALQHMEEWENGTYKLSNGATLVNKKYQDTNQELKNINSNLENVGSKTTKIIKKIGRWAMAVFGIRSAYMFVRNAINTITQEDEQLLNDIQLIKVALAYTIEPLVRGIVNLMKVLMSYIAYIVKAWTGRDIFASAKNNLASANKSAKELQKTSASFDKFNKIGNSSASGAGGGIGTLETPEDKDVPKWIKWIADNKDLVIGALIGIATALLLIKLADPTTLIVIVIALIAYLIVYIKKHWEEIKDLLKIAWDYIKEFFKGLLDTIGSIISNAFIHVRALFTYLYEIMKAPFVVLWDTIKGVFNGILTTIKGWFGVIKGIFTGDWQKVMNSFKQIFKGTFDTLWSIAKAPLNLIISGINALIKGLNQIKIDVPNWVPSIGGKKLGFNIKTIPKLERGGIVHNVGSGVLMGNYIAGEGRNPEAVIPLDDATLDRLGRAIAKHSQINATIVNEMDGRVLSKNLARVNNENAFARNGGY